jgi:type I restriction enzyme M protein
MSTSQRYSDPLGRYYTRSAVGAFLISQMPSIKPRRILDLGSGAGALSIAALQRWSDAGVYAVDIDARAKNGFKIALGEGARFEHIEEDALSAALPGILAERTSFLDAAVCNPPFTTPAWRPHFLEILESVGLSGSYPYLRRVDAAVLFLAQNLALIDRGATLGIVLPDSLVSSARYKEFRRELLSRYEVLRVIKLPRNAFRNTEALAHIAILRKTKPVLERIEIGEVAARLPDERIYVDRHEAIERLDFDFHVERRLSIRKRNATTLKEVARRLQRGSVSSAEARSLGVNALHTTSITSAMYGLWCDLRSFSRCIRSRDVVRAQPGDILVARVGRNLEQKVIGVKSGTPVISDCLYLIRVEKALRESVLRELSSPMGRKWLISRSYGVAARQLTKADLLQFPVEVSKSKRQSSR